MDAYCPRCQDFVSQVDQTVLVQGRCPNCGGQINLGDVSAPQVVNGAIAMTFDAGSRVAVPLHASFEETSLGLDVNGGPSPRSASRLRRRRPPPPPSDALMGSGTEPASDDEQAEPASSSGASTAAGDVSLGGPHGVSLKPELHSSMEGDNRATDVASGPHDNPMSPVERPTTAGAQEVEARPPHAAPAGGEQEAPAYPSATHASEESAMSENEPPSGNEPRVDIPSADVKADSEPVVGAHLQLPSIDFSMPTLDISSDKSSSTSTPMSSEGVPAHLQLPNFPDFELPPIPGEDSGELSIKGVEGGAGSLGDMNAGESNTSVPLRAAEDADDNWAMAGASQPAMPPPLPEPPPLPASGKPRNTSPPLSVAPGLPAMDLPTFKPVEVTRDPTLLQSTAAQRIAEDIQKKSSLPIFLVLLLVVAVGGGAFTFFWVGPEQVASWFRSDAQTHVGPTKRDRAETLVFDGKNAYLEGVKEEKAKKPKEARKKFDVAIHKFREAIGIDPSLGATHRNLAIALAKAGKQAEAVKHYQLYLQKTPRAKDRKDVQKIIDDWNKAKEKQKRGRR
jgi:hypothetical protein